MSSNKVVLLFGIILVVLPFLGFPVIVKTVCYVVMGFVLIFQAFSAHMQRRIKEADASQ